MSGEGLSESWATLWESMADAQPDEVAVVIGGAETTWSRFDDRAALLAGALRARGVAPGARFAQRLYNCPEYMESVYAAFKLRATPVNVNYRYKAPEIAYICDNAEAEVLVFHGSLGQRVAEARADMPTVKVLLQVDDGSPLADGAEWYHEAVDAAAPMEQIARSGEDALMLYTGGTTGYPKGVVWRHVDLYQALGWASYTTLGIDVPTTAEGVGAMAAQLKSDGRAPVMLCAPPLMHGTALFLAISSFCLGGDGTATLLGRGSICINSGGEKIYPEEVEVAARLHPTVVDANVVGIPHERFGESVALVCSVSEPTDPDDIVATITAQTADYKRPRTVVFVDEVFRAPNGESDYKWARKMAVEVP